MDSQRVFKTTKNSRRGRSIQTILGIGSSKDLSNENTPKAACSMTRFILKDPQNVYSKVYKHFERIIYRKR